MNLDDIRLGGSKRVSRRTVIRGAGIAGAGLAGAALIGCGSDDGDTTPSPTTTARPGGTVAPTATPAPQAQRGTVVRAAVDEPIPATLIPALNEVNWIPRHGVFDSLILQGEDFQPEMLMAETFEFSPDFTKLHVRLKPDIEFHNGRPFTSDDVRKTVQFFQRQDIASQLKLPAGMIKDMQTPDARTIDFTFDAPRPFMTDTFAYMPMLDHEAIEGDGWRDMTKLNGTGAYRWAQYTPQVGYVVEAYPNYYREGHPLLERIEAKIIPDAQAKLLALQAGEVDHVHSLLYSQVKGVEGDSKLKTAHWENGGVNFLAMVVTYGPLQDPRVRLAISYAIDRERYSEEYLEGLMPPHTLMWVPGSPGYFEDQNNAVSYDPERAKSLLAEAGYASGFTLPMDVGAIPEREIPAQLFAQDLADVGIKVDIQVSEYAAYLERFRSRTIEASWPSNTGSSNTMHPGWVFSSDQMVRVPNAAHFETDEYKEFLSRITQVDPRSPEGQERMRWFNDLWQMEPWIAACTGRLQVSAGNVKMHGFEPTGGRRGFPRDWWIEA